MSNKVVSFLSEAGGAALAYSNSAFVGGYSSNSTSPIGLFS